MVRLRSIFYLWAFQKLSAVKKKILYGLLIILVGIQFVRPDRENPAVEDGKDFVAVMQPPAEVADMMITRCYDCHSNETVWPWYTNVAPVSWWVADHVEHGRGHLNFSVWADYEEGKATHKLEECYEELEEGEMPLESWTYMHEGLNETERATLVAYFKGEYLARGGEEHEHDHEHEGEEH